ncbi:MAG: hypothetical protein IPP47_22690 [Bryobacterales bacterium]|nr:hypothetical protein [Bryobacterales bacterium]
MTGLTRRDFGASLGAVSGATAAGRCGAQDWLRRELLVDDALIASMRGVEPT